MTHKSYHIIVGQQFFILIHPFFYTIMIYLSQSGISFNKVTHFPRLIYLQFVFCLYEVTFLHDEAHVFG